MLSGLGERRATPFVELRGVALHPPKHRRVVNGNAAFLHSFFDIPIVQSIAEILSHSTRNDLTRKVTPFEQGGLSMPNLRYSEVASLKPVVADYR
jgi:hypothetical protein